MEDVSSVGAFEAKTHLSALLDRVEKGEEIIITKHGKAVARLIPAERNARNSINAAMERLMELRSSAKLDGLSWRDLRDEGRR